MLQKDSVFLLIQFGFRLYNLNQFCQN